VYVKRNILIRSGLLCITNVSVPSWMTYRTKTCRTNCTHTPLEIPICGLFDVWWDLIWTHMVLLCRMENSESIFLFYNWGYFPLSLSASLSVSLAHIHSRCVQWLYSINYPSPSKPFQLKSEGSICGGGGGNFIYIHWSFSLFIIKCD
jgi:hypothetical protein